jgi:uncharacterized protein
MILPDVNILIHAYNSSSPAHLKAKAWWEKSLSGNEGIGIAWVTILGFIRITTHRQIFINPLSPQQASSCIDLWLSLPQVHLTNPSSEHFLKLKTHLENLGTAGNLTTDAHLATLAIERGYTLYSTDADFHRFSGLKWINPLS